MKQGGKWNPALTTRIALMIFIVSTVLLSVFAFLMYQTSQTEMRNAMDQALLSSAAAMASRVEEDYEGIEIEFNQKVIQSSSKTGFPDLYAVILGQNNIARVFPESFEVPGFARNAPRKTIYTDLEYEGTPYRSILLPALTMHDHSSDQGSEISIFYAISTLALHRQLSAISFLLAVLCIIGLVVSALSAYVITRIGLKPLTRLATDISTIDEDDLSSRISDAGLPSDLSPVAYSVNAMMARIEGAFERERQFSADAAHELRTPVATLKSGIQSALLNQPDNQKDREAMQELLIDVQRIEDLCASLLFLESARRSRNSVSMPVNDWIDEIETVIESLRPLAQNSGATISLNKPESVDGGVRINSDRDTTLRIVSNLIDNAIIHGNGGVKIDVEIRLECHSAVLTVRDNGSGIAPEDVPNLFKRFHRGDKARSREKGGAGLGLAITQSLAESHGGKITYEAAEPSGCLFTWHVNL